MIPRLTLAKRSNVTDSDDAAGDVVPPIEQRHHRVTSLEEPRGHGRRRTTSSVSTASTCASTRQGSARPTFRNVSLGSPGRDARDRRGSGSGKTTLLSAILGLLPDRAARRPGTCLRLTATSSRSRSRSGAVSAGRPAAHPQRAMTSLSPVTTILHSSNSSPARADTTTSTRGSCPTCSGGSACKSTRPV